MRVCLVGSGGREHALARALARTADVVIAPGNPGMGGAADPDGGPGPGAGPALGGSGRGADPGAGPGSLTCDDRDPAAIEADLWVIGPEAPLVGGLADRLRAGGRAVFGPGADGARLEGSKAWMKELLDEAGVPTAAHRSFDAPGPAVAYLSTLSPPWVIKTDGLAAGKGVLVTTDRAEAEADVRAKLAGETFGDAGRRVVIEEGLTGPELSLMALCDGRRAVPLAPARDHKRLGDGDSGPNTGGMGAYSPVPGVDDALVDEIMAVAVRPTLAALADRGIDYRGVLYAGLMLTPGGPRVIEFNVRFGDPEIQAVAARWNGDVAAVLAAAAAGRLDRVQAPSFDDRASVAVVLAAAGYPGVPRTGDPITGIDEAARIGDLSVCTAGVAAGPDGGLLTAGGRVLAVQALGATLGEARDLAYRGAELISWEGCTYRRDIAAGGPPLGDSTVRAGVAPGAAVHPVPGWA